MNTSNLPEFIDKMKSEGLQSIAIDTFSYYYEQVVSGATGLIRDSEITPLKPSEIPHLDDLQPFQKIGKQALAATVRIILNGGLGTSMGLTGPKSLLPVRSGLNFLEILLRQSERIGVRVALMNSFSTHEDTLTYLTRREVETEPLTFVQHKFPKILKETLSPVVWPKQPELEWNPPGHGDIYTALVTSGMLARLLRDGVEYAFISNCDNLGAVLDESLLGYFADKSLPFLMEVAQRTPADVKGGHLARHQDGHLLLRESAQCPDDELDAFRDIDRYRFFNTNNLWVNLKYLDRLVQEQGTVRLPMILNPKTVDPRDKTSPKVHQIETAMGSAISLFEGSGAVCVPRSRFFPVKKTNELLVVRSDYFIFEEPYLRLNPDRTSNAIDIRLDPERFGKIDDFDRRFDKGAPSLVACESLAVIGDVRFGAGVVIRGKAVIRQTSEAPVAVPDNAVVQGERDL